MNVTDARGRRGGGRVVGGELRGSENLRGKVWYGFDYINGMCVVEEESVGYATDASTAVRCTSKERGLGARCGGGGACA